MAKSWVEGLGPTPPSPTFPRLHIWDLEHGMGLTGYDWVVGEYTIRPRAISHLTFPSTVAATIRHGLFKVRSSPAVPSSTPDEDEHPLLHNAPRPRLYRLRSLGGGGKVSPPRRSSASSPAASAHSDSVAYFGGVPGPLGPASSGARPPTSAHAGNKPPPLDDAGPASAGALSDEPQSPASASTPNKPHKRNFSSRLRLSSIMASGPTTPLSPTAGSFDHLDGSEKRKDIENILERLEVDIVKTNILPPIRNEILERLKTHTTAVEDLDPLLTRRGVSVLGHQGFESASPTTGRIALRCLCNIMLFSEPCRQWFVDEGFPREAVARMKVDNREDELLSSRLLFLCTYNTNLNFDPLFEKEGFAEAVNTNLARHAKMFTKTGDKTPPLPMAVSACNETLKLLYNVTNFYQHQAPAFSKSILPILKMIKNVHISSPPLQQPVSSLINALIHLDIEDKKARIFTVNQNPMFPVFDTNINIEQLIHILDLALQAYPDEEVDKYVAPLVQVLLRISEFAPAGPKARMRALLLPSDKDREKVLGQGDSLPARLLRLSAAPMAPNLRQHVPALLFELSDKDARRFVKNVGYGFAAGFLVNNGVQIPSSAMEAWSTGETDDHEITNPSRRGSRATPASPPVGTSTGYFNATETDHGDALDVGAGPGPAISTATTQRTGIVEDVTDEPEEPTAGPSTASPAAAATAPKVPRMVEINPITGQRRDREPTIADGPPMTEDEKLREAERMFVLFERLRATGVVDVENPVAKALREGAFEDMD